MYVFFEVTERAIDAFESKIFSVRSKGTGISNLATRDKVFDHSKVKILTPKQMLQRLPIALAQVKAGNNSKNLLNDCLFFVSIKKKLLKSM